MTFFGEDFAPIVGEVKGAFSMSMPHLLEAIVDKNLTFEQASKCLNTLGKDESGFRYAYLMLTATSLKLTDVSMILNFKHVLFLDLTDNFLSTEALEVLTAMPFLVLLKAERNRVTSPVLSPMPYLQVLVLSQNQIQDTGDIHQPMLECLEISHNDIYMTHFDNSTLPNLKLLEIRSNLLFELSGSYPASLEMLILQGNKITTIHTAELARLEKLKMLHLRENHLEKLQGFSENLRELTYLNLRNNKIRKLKEFMKLKCLPKLDTLVVSGNPIPASEVQLGGEDFGEGNSTRDPLVLPLLVMLPQLKRINKHEVTIEDRIEAEDIHNEVLEGLLAGEEESDREGTTTDLTSEYPTESESERLEDA